MKNFIAFGIAFITVLLLSCCREQANENTVAGKKNETANEPKFDNKLTDREISGGVMTPEIMWKFGRVSEARISPDGKIVIYAVKRFDVPTNKSKNEIFSVSVTGGEPKLLTNHIGQNFNPRWRPDGKKIGFLSDKSGVPQIWEMNPDGSDKKQATDIPDGINSFEYSPAGSRILYTKDVKLDKTASEVYSDLPKADVRIIDNLMYRHWDNWHDYAYSHIFVADYMNGKMNNGGDIMQNEKFDSPLSPYFDNAEIRWSRDGKMIAYTCKKMSGKEYALSTNSDIYVYFLETGKTENISQGMNGYDKYPVFSYDSKYIAWQSMETPGYESDKDRLIIYDFATKEKKDVTQNFEESVSNLTWSKDDGKIYFISGIKATFHVFSFDIKVNKISQVTKGVHNYHALQCADNTLIGEKTSMSMANEIFRIDENTGKETQLTFTNKNIYDKIEMGKVEERWVKTYDNKDMLVWLIYPPKFDPKKKYPAILFCQGGPQDAVSQFFSFRWNFQMMAANGYVVIAPNRRGLPTFGREWNDQIALDYGGKNMKDYLSAVDAIKKEPFIDTDKIGAVGPSYGGYSIYWLAGHHEKRFKAFIAHCGMFNLESQYGTTEEYFFVNHDLGGPYWNKPKPKSYEFSPHLAVQNWDAPILIIHGGRDFRIPYTQAMEAFNAAQLRGVPSRFLFFPEESHFVLKPQNAILWQREFKAWLDKYVKK
ncbi:MAG: S9 family peptidase [Bacteroidetes bacterium]|nr:S9 family peptidase [Bacteroidota bacterium]